VLRAELDVSGLNRGLDRVPTQIVAAIQTKMNAVTINLQQHVIHDKLHGQVLKQRSGRLAKSIQRLVQRLGEIVTGLVFSSGDVKYARIHEYGGRTAPHDIVPKKAEALAFAIGGKTVFAKIVHHPGSEIPERSFLRSSLADQATEIAAGLKKAALEGAKRALNQ